MTELYAESGVKRKENGQSIAMRIGLIAFIIISIFISGLSPILSVLPIAAILITIYMFPKLSVEYEYVFCDGQLDFDKIMGKSKRKNMLKVDFEQIEIIAPSNSHSLDAYKNNNLKKLDYYSLDAEAKTYTLIGAAMGKSDGEKVRIIFEPSDKMIECMRLKAPRKVVTY